MPIGALAGGAMGTWLGLRATLLVGGVGSLLAVSWVWWSPVRALRAVPEVLETEMAPPSPPEPVH